MKLKFLSVIALAASTLAFAGPVSSYGKLQAKNGQLYGQKINQAIQLEGMSMFWDVWSAEMYTKDVVKKLVDDWKIELIRVAHGTGGNRLSNWQSKNDEVIQAAIDNDIYVIIDFHSPVKLV